MATGDGCRDRGSRNMDPIAPRVENQSGNAIANELIEVREFAGFAGFSRFYRFAGVLEFCRFSRFSRANRANREPTEPREPREPSEPCELIPRFEVDAIAELAAVLPTLVVV